MSQPGSSRVTLYKCALCKTTVSDKRMRKVLSPESAGRVHLQQIQAFCEEQHPGYNVQEALQTLPTNEQYICKADQLSKWEKLEKQLGEIRQAISLRVDNLCAPPITTSNPVTLPPTRRPPAIIPASIAPKRLRLPQGTSPELVVSQQVIRVKNSWGLPPHALESLAKHWSVSAQLNIH